MSKVTLNPMFQNHSGRMGRIVHYSLFGKQYCRIHVIPKNPRTECQQAVRRTFADAVNSWRRLLPEQKAEYNRKARKKRMRGYNLYISKYMKGGVTVDSASVQGIQPVTSRLSSFTLNSAHTVAAPMQLRSSSDDASVQVKERLYPASTLPVKDS
ncbi:MAG TPA: hypothetical protein PK514_04690 [Spirochaetota bacterium]|nr:hypothetical protein [Spirochaetota bacterium]